MNDYSKTTKENLKSAICEKGHLQLSTLYFYEVYPNSYCKECGSKIIDKCPHCNAEIQGGVAYHRTGRESVVYRDLTTKTEKYPNNTVPKYCHNCGKPYPWTEAFLNTYKDTLSLVLENEKELQSKIYNTTEELVKNNFDLKSPMANFFKLLLNKTGDLAKDVVVNTLSSIASEQFLQFVLK